MPHGAGSVVSSPTSHELEVGILRLVLALRDVQRAARRRRRRPPRRRRRVSANATTARCDGVARACSLLASPSGRAVPDAAVAVDAAARSSRASRTRAQRSRARSRRGSGAVLLEHVARCARVIRIGSWKFWSVNALEWWKPLRAFESVLADEVVRDVAVVAGGDGVVRTLLPAVVLLVHDVAVGAGARVVAQVGEPLGVAKVNPPRPQQRRSARPARARPGFENCVTAPSLPLRSKARRIQPDARGLAGSDPAIARGSIQPQRREASGTEVCHACSVRSPDPGGVRARSPARGPRMPRTLLRRATRAPIRQRPPNRTEAPRWRRRPTSGTTTRAATAQPSMRGSTRATRW